MVEEEIARWMLGELPQAGYLRQARVARQVRERWGERHVYKNRNRNWALSPTILEEFRKITPEDVVWSRSYQGWRRRREGDPAGRMVR